MYSFIMQERGTGKKTFLKELSRIQIFDNLMKLTGCTIIYGGENASYSESENQQKLLFTIISDLACIAGGYEDAYTNEKAIKNLSTELFGNLIEACAKMQLNEITMQLLHLRQNVNDAESHLRL